MVQIIIEMFFMFWMYLAEILFIERFLKVFGVDPHSKKVHHVILAHTIQISLVLIIMYLAVIFYLTVIKY